MKKSPRFRCTQPEFIYWLFNNCSLLQNSGKLSLELVLPIGILASVSVVTLIALIYKRAWLPLTVILSDFPEFHTLDYTDFILTFYFSLERMNSKDC